MGSKQITAAVICENLSSAVQMINFDVIDNLFLSFIEVGRSCDNTQLLFFIRALLGFLLGLSWVFTSALLGFLLGLSVLCDRVER